MSIDPRSMKALLQAQLAPKLDFGAHSKKSARGSSDENVSPFDTILTSRLAGSQGEPDNSGKVPVWSDTLWEQLASFSISPVNSASTLMDKAGSFDSSSPFAGLIQNASAKYGVSPSLIQAVIQTESSFNPLAQSHAGAKGLMQLMDGTARGLGVTDSFDPVQNIEGGTRYLAMLLRKYGGEEAVALAAYNAGPGRIDRLGISSQEELLAKWNELPAETQRYIGKVQQAIL
ncbi:lytic transglycosylase domain-containing protein [Paenibacillus paeoniae]|uniref:Lytic transglycosylase domain-containing protein n=1 Tax=Paenibacillus paeoniae TaxID=2292705 RepID=A0A371PJ28_9BACL|nr:lytic transglycosylase domain-containing protein [Paenibacillus paeoniae]REK76218.1 lytic transglycosylase domain-containing protein [Paenibacillus paeoniae]